MLTFVEQAERQTAARMHQTPAKASYASIGIRGRWQAAC
jgi:hypothetical protein